MGSFDKVLGVVLVFIALTLALISYVNLQVDRWPGSGYVKKLQRKDGTFYYYNKSRECKDKDVHRMKIYAY